MLLLFDIDGTLLQRASREHAIALRQALQHVHGVCGVDQPATITGNRVPQGSAAGRTDGEIARLLLLDAGIPEQQIDAGAAAVREECCRLYAELCPSDLSSHLIPGIPELLDQLGAREEVRLSLVTGNYEPVARTKLAAAGIAHHFKPGQGGFGSDAEDRAKLPAIARTRAGAAAGAWPRERTVVIGDTPRDISCARADGLRVIAVTTGPHPASDLTGADAIATDAAQVRAAIDAMLKDQAACDEVTSKK